MAMAAIAGEVLGKRFSCFDDQGQLVVLCSADAAEARELNDPGSDIRKNGRLFMVLTDEVIDSRKRRFKPVYPFRELEPGDYFEVPDKARHNSVRSGAADVQRRVAGVAFRTAVSASGSLLVQRIDMAKVDLSMLGRRGRPPKAPEMPGNFLGNFAYGEARYPYRQMQVGDWFCVLNAGQSLRVNCSNKARALGIKLSVHQKAGAMLVVRVK